MTTYWRRCCGRFVVLESWLMTGGAICFAVSQTFAFSTNSAVAQIGVAIVSRQKTTQDV
ncbi:hypothetical protein [Scytonema sp. PRP1]|uniref:hypothetical protein n=1 Tax=Scytonema sp. PRP1 TaxID=3120513 RepID=UPI00300C7E79